MTKLWDRWMACLGADPQATCAPLASDVVLALGLAVALIMGGTRGGQAAGDGARHAPRALAHAGAVSPARLLGEAAQLLGCGILRGRRAEWTAAALAPTMATIAEQWFLWTLTVVGGRVLYVMWAQNTSLALVWVVKLVTDPLTDIVVYSPRYLRRS